MKSRLYVAAFLFFLLLFPVLLRAQYNLPQSRIWAMGNKIGLDFTDLSNPVPISTNLSNTNEAAASVCDTSGHMLFYSNGNTVWNRNGVQMPHGTLLAPSYSTLSTTQGAVIVPVPGDADRYYLFSLTAVSNCQLFCNRIDMNLDGGLGDVDTTFPLRGQSLADSFLTEKMTVVPGCNNSVWLVVHTQNTPVFRAYHITSSGIDLTPVLSAVGSFPGANYQQGVMKFSPDHTRLLSCNFRASAPSNAGLEVFKFDNTTGLLFDGLTLDNGSYYGGTFSPDGSKVYAGSTAVINAGSVSQWDLLAPAPASSKVTLGPCGQYADLKLGPDGKIYFGALVKSNGYNNYRFMGRVNVPDSPGTACNFQDSVSSIVFPNPNNANTGLLSQGLPNDVAVPVMAPGSNQYLHSLDTTICRLFQPFVLQAPAGYNSCVWDNGDTTLARTVTARGTYWVKSLTACGERVDTMVLRGADMPALLISYADPVLTATTGFASYQWYRDGQPIAGAATDNYQVQHSGTYSVTAVFGSACSDSASFAVTNVAGVAEQQLVQGLNVYPNPARNTVFIAYREPVNLSVRSMDGREVLKAIHVNSFDISRLADGCYLLVITDARQQRLGQQRLVKAAP